LNGLRTSAGLAVIGAIVGDFFFSRGDPGLGKLIQFFFLNNLAGPMFVSALIASSLGFAFFAVFELATRRTVGRWHEGAR
jgi:NitT/TauT family transport system permease protein